MPVENAQETPEEEQPVEVEGEETETVVEKEAEPEPTAEAEPLEPEAEIEPAEQEVPAPPEAEPQLPPPSPQPISSSSEHNWAMLSHLTILLNLITGFLGPIVALIIYLVYRDRSRYIAYQSLQSTIFQLVTWIGVGLLIGAIWLVTAALSIVLIGILLIPFALLATIFLLAVPLAALIYGVYAGIKCSQGEDFQYWLVGNWVRGTYEGT